LLTEIEAELRENNFSQKKKDFSPEEFYHPDDLLWPLQSSDCQAIVNDGELVEQHIDCPF
jgi:hypothetical protein